MIYGIEQDLWEYLSGTKKNIVMYGMGNGADKILNICAQKGIEINDFFASDGFVRGHSFHGKVVLSYSDVKQKYGCENLIVLLSFASNLPDVLGNIYRIAGECELYAPDVPVFGNGLFDMDFFYKSQGRIKAARELFADKKSVNLFDNIIKYKLSGDIKYLSDTDADKTDIYANILKAGNFEYIADLGAYNGDTIREIIPFASKLKKVTAFEPDQRSMKKLTAYADTVNSFCVDPVCACAWSEDTVLFFDASGNRNSGALENISDGINVKASKIKEIPAKTLDGVLGGERIDYIKYDVEGSERQALYGSKESIAKYSPALLVSAYHRNEDIFELPELIKELNPGYSLYLRRTPYLPAWDLHILAVNRDN